MDNTQRVLVTLIKSALTGEALELPEDVDLEAAYRLIRRHHITTLAYDGAVRCGISRSEPVMGQLFRDYCLAMMKSEGQMRELERLFAAFDREKIDYMPLKGTLMKDRYPKPELRIMGDADVLIRLSQYDRIVPVMESLGFASVLESNHELIWKTRDLYLELHKYLIPTYNEDYAGYFGNGWSLAKLCRGTRYAMTPEDEFIYLFTHFAKHFRDGGIGCRHVADLWVYLRQFPELDMEYVNDALNQVGLLEFHGYIRKLLDCWFGEGESDARTEFIGEFIFASGSWGDADSSVLSQAVKASRKARRKAGGRAGYILRNLFPGVEAQRQNYPVLDRAPWLLPAVWLVRPVRKLLFDRDSLRRHRRNVKTLSRERLDDRRRLLNFVGLDYRF